MLKDQFQSQLMDWYYDQKRVLPWRDDPTPYRVWISEIMLQQTKVSTVIPYFERFLKRLPTIEDLAAVDEDELLKLWEGLGYYNRVRNLHKAAKLIVESFDGIIPSEKEALEKLPGIGDYTSGAIASIAFNKKYTAVDGNVFRVFARLLAIQEDIKQPTVKQQIRDVVTYLLPDDAVGDFNQALMEIGAMICLPNGSPKCEICPLKEQCLAYQKGLMNDIPLRRKKKNVPTQNMTVLLIRNNNKYKIEKRPNTGLLASMYQFPMIEGHTTISYLKQQYNTINIKELKRSKHVFSHLIWDMKAYVVEIEEKVDGLYVSPEEILDKYSIPTAFKEYKKYIGETDE